MIKENKINKPLVIGICGGMGSGKSVISYLLGFYGIPVFDTDQAAKDIYQDAELIPKFETIINAPLHIDGKLNKKALSAIVFSEDSTAKGSLHNLINTTVRDRFNQWTAKQSCSMVGIECSILFRSKYHQFCDKILFIDAPEAIRIARVQKRNHLPKTEIVKRINIQKDELLEAKCHSDLIINNDTKHSLILTIENFISNISKKKHTI